jgi:hypothetical protein
VNFVPGVALVIACAWVAVGCSDAEEGGGANAGSGGVSPSGGAGETGGTTTSTGGRTTASGGRASNGSGAATFGGLTSATTGGAPATGGASSGGEAAEPSGDECDPLSPEELVFDGDLVVTSDNYAEAREYTEVTGDLVPDPMDIELPVLRRVGGSLRMIGSPSETGDEPEVHVRFPQLEEVGGELYFYLNWGLRTLDARRLERVGGRVVIHRNKYLDELQLESLLEYGAEFEITGNISLPDCYLDTVREIASNIQEGLTGCTCVRECRVVTATCL